MSENCLICRNTDLLLVVNDDLILKLQNLVYEIDWKIYFKICQNCIQRLNNAYEFKNVCIDSYKNLKNYCKRLELTVHNNVDSDKETCKLELGVDSCISNLGYEQQNQLTAIKLQVNPLEKDTFDHKKEIWRKKKLCIHCGKLFSITHILKKHLNVCTKRQNGLQKCDNEDLAEDNHPISPTCQLCGKSFVNKYILKRHTRNVHASEKNFKCKICSSAFPSPVYLNAHMRYHIRDRTCICSFCGKGFITASELYHHEKIHANKRSYRCEKCPKAFNTSSYLHKHIMCVHLEKSKWKYVCPHCNKRFPFKTNLDTHIKMHTGEKNYICHICNRKCINKAVLARHIETHSNIIAFKCEICLQGYKYRRSLNLHMSKIHGFGEVISKERIRKFLCQICPKSYFDNSKLQKHIKTHNKNRQIL